MALTYTRLTEIKTIEIVDFIDVNVILLRWINELGGQEQWLFNINQMKELSVTDQVVAKLNIESLITQTATHKVRSNRKWLRYNLRAEGLTANQWDVLSQQLGGSLSCEVWDATLSKWFTAIIEPAERTRQTRGAPYEFEIVIIMPEIQTQSI